MVCRRARRRLPRPHFRDHHADQDRDDHHGHDHTADRWRWPRDGLGLTPLGPIASLLDGITELFGLADFHSIGYAVNGTVFPAVSVTRVTVQSSRGAGWATAGQRPRSGPMATIRSPSRIPGTTGFSTTVRSDPRSPSVRVPGMPGPLLVVDAPFLLYRSFFALPDSIRVRSAARAPAARRDHSLLRIAADVSPRAVIVCFGAEQAPYRVELYAGYHAQRPPMPEALAHQWRRRPSCFAPLAGTWRMRTSWRLTISSAHTPSSRPHPAGRRCYSRATATCTSASRTGRTCSTSTGHQWL